MYKNRSCNQIIASLEKTLEKTTSTETFSMDNMTLFANSSNTMWIVVINYNYNCAQIFLSSNKSTKWTKWNSFYCLKKSEKFDNLKRNSKLKCLI